MGANNFGSTNASKMFTVLMGYYEPVLDENDEETGEERYTQPEHWECENLRDEIKSTLEQLPYSYSKPYGYRDGEVGLGVIWKSRLYGDVEVMVNVDCSMEIGYHEGGKLDWKIEYQIDGSTYEENELDLDVIEKDFNYVSELRVGLQKILSKKAQSWMLKTKEELVKAIEEVYENYCDKED